MKRVHKLWVGWLLLNLLLAACAPVQSPAAQSNTSSTTQNAAGYPVTIQDCDGRATTYDKAPERVVTFDPAVVEALLLLGLQDRIVGYTDFQTPEQRWAPTKADFEALNRINDGTNYPSKEAVVALAPDLVMSIYPSALLNNTTLPDREGWAKLGINAYLTQSGCDQGATPRTDLSLLYTDLRNFGLLFGVQERAEAEIAKLQARIEALQAKAQAAGVKPLTIWTYSGEEEPFPAGAVNTANAIISMAGAKNVFADMLKSWDTVSWEEIVKRNPDAIWIMTSAGSGYIEEAEGIKQKLAADPRLTNVTAVRNAAYVIVSYNEGGVASPRNVDALEQMIDGLIALQ